MRKWITFLMTFLVGSVSYVNANTGSSQVNFEAGYRRDNLSWSLEAPSCDPLFKLSSKFKDIDIFQIGVRARTHVGCNFYARASANWGWVLDGDFEESIKIFADNFRDTCDCDNFATNGFDGFDCDDGIAVEFTRDSENIIDDKFVADVDIALGYPFYFCDCSLYVAPVIGYSFHEQNICIEDVEELDFFATDGFFLPGEGDECCCQKQVFRWYGPFIGVDFGYQPYGECWNIWASLEYHIGRFNFKRHHHNHGFSGIDGFDSTSRHAHGWVFAAGADYDFGNCWTIGFSVKFQDWSATRHHHDCEFDDSELGFHSDDEVRTHANWHSFAINVAVGYEF